MCNVPEHLECSQQRGRPARRHNAKQANAISIVSSQGLRQTTLTTADPTVSVQSTACTMRHAATAEAAWPRHLEQRHLPQRQLRASPATRPRILRQASDTGRLLSQITVRTVLQIRSILEELRHNVALTQQVRRVPSTTAKVSAQEPALASSSRSTTTATRFVVSMMRRCRLVHSSGMGTRCAASSALRTKGFGGPLDRTQLRCARLHISVTLYMLCVLA